jgi:NADH dehydrogenase
VGTALRQCLGELPNEARSLGPSNDLEAAFRDADAVVHLAGTLLPHKPNTYRAANLDTVLATTAALAGSQAQRVVFLSFLGAHLDADNAYLRYKAEAEQVLRSGPIPAVIFQCDHIYGPPTEPGPTASAFLAESGKVRLLGTGTQRLAPLFRNDVVEAIVQAALDPETPTGTFEFAGPDTMTSEEFAYLLNPETIRIRRTPAMLARLLGRVASTLTPELVDVMLADTVPTQDVTATARLFGVELHHVGEVWRSQ